ncbi:MAG: S1 RNA-binding domain-containing protein [Lachnospiraceae bacterium]|nr:S1 RNA-binding domain-containing protein [Lachnospiraceae bacterium]
MGYAMDDFKEELNASFQKLEDGDIMSGKVEGEENAENTLAWNRLKELKDSKETINVKVGGMVNGGLIAYVEEQRGFIPASQISMEFVDNLDEYLGKNLDVRVITVDKARKQLVLSAKVILKEELEAKKEAARDGIKVGDVKEGKVESLQSYGAFIDLGDGISGLLHISQIANKRLKHPGEVLKEGDTVRVKVIKTEDNKISLSMKALEETGGEETEERVDIPKSAPLTTSLGDLLKGIKL